jgi:tetratricopeptide (TPR) repeat protein
LHCGRPLSATVPVFLALACSSGTPGPPERNPSETPPPTPTVSKLGSVDFPVSCNDKAQAAVENGVVLVQHMTFNRAADAFRTALKDDPQCGMAYWGLAMAQIHPLWAGTVTEDQIEQGRAWLDKAEAGTSLTPREQGYVDAVAAFYEGEKPRPERLSAFADGFEKLSAANPDDLEALAFYAVALLSTASPDDKTFAIQEKAGAIAQGILDKVPNHPGGHHYLIHAYDNPLLAEKALAVARNYGKIAPDNAHALHMPSHIFTRLGYWPESVEWNLKSAAAALKVPAPGNATSGHYLHAQDYLEYAYLQMAMDDKAAEVRDKTTALRMPIAVNPAVAYSLSCAPARYALERNAWKAASRIEPRIPAGFPWDNFPAWEAPTYFARGIGAARSNDQEAAAAAIERLKQLERKTEPPYWKTQVQIRRVSVEAWTLYAAERKEAALERIAEAARMEAATDKSPMTPGEVLPAQELYGDMLLMEGRPEKAEVQYEAVLARSPNRFRALYGAGMAAEKADLTDEATEYYSRLLEITEGAAAKRPELAHAAEFVGKQ